MSMTATCPQCQTRIEVPGDMADQPIQCHRCMTVFERGNAVAIQAGAAPVSAPSLAEPPASRPHREARAPFPVVPLLLMLIGVLLFMLVASVGFNVYMIVSPDNGLRDNERAVAEANAQRQRAAAAQAMQEAEANRKQAEFNQARLQKQVEDLRRERDEAREALRLLGKDEK